MIVVDEARWTQQLSEFEAGDERGQAFKDFLVAWTDRAEEALAASADLTPVSALTTALLDIEAERGRVTIGDIGQMLVVLAAFWTHGEAMVAALSPIEMRLVQDTVALKVATLAQEAMETTTQGESHE